MVYVLNLEGEPLMPTNNAKARKLLKNQKAKVVKVKPFVIQLLYRTTEYKQSIILGIDSGYLNIGFSAITNKKELLVGEVKMLKGMKDRLLERSQYRKIRRQRLRYRKPRFNNRKRDDGWLAPSIQHKLDTHIKIINEINRMLPISNIIVEVANFDIQKIKNPNIRSEEYQQGEQMGFWNLREYILYRDGHKCQNPNCKNKSKDQILEIHHIKYKSEGGTNVPSNLITLCNKCHTSPNHKKGKFLYDWMMKKKKVKGFKDATFMSMVRWKIINELKTKYKSVNFTYGYMTKNHRIQHAIEKTHYNDAFAIAKGTNQIRCKDIWTVEQSRLNNRSLEKFYDAKYIDVRTNKKVSASELNNGRRTRNKNLNSENLKIYRGKKISKGRRSIRVGKSKHQPNDLIKYKGVVYTVKGSQNKGSNIALKEIKKVPNVKYIIPYIYKKGFNWKNELYK